MAHFLLFVFVFASQLIAGISTQKLPPPDSRNVITILSIDGGGIKGIIPSTVLDYLDKALKDKDPKADLAHYFDVIAGTSTGGLVAAMLATPSPNDPNRPLFTPAEIVQFYKENGPHIFNASRPGDGPEFDGKFLHSIIRKLMRNTRLTQTLTNVVIPTFDLKKQKPIIFSNYKLKTLPYLNAKMSDISISTSAAPTALPPYYFENDGFEFNMADGGVAAGNPTQAAISEVTRYNKYTQILVLSLGTGKTKVEEKYDAKMAATWGRTMWLTVGLDFLRRASTDMVEYYLATVFSGFQPANNYLRIEEYNLDPSLAGTFNVTKRNMDGLEQAGKELLRKKVVKMNLDTFDLQETGQGTYAKALDRWAEILFNERRWRLKRNSMGKGEDADDHLFKTHIKMKN